MKISLSGDDLCTLVRGETTHHNGSLLSNEHGIWAEICLDVMSDEEIKALLRALSALARKK